MHNTSPKTVVIQEEEEEKEKGNDEESRSRGRCVCVCVWGFFFFPRECRKSDPIYGRAQECQESWAPGRSTVQ